MADWNNEGEKRMRLVFIILQYNTFEETEECIKSIKENMHNDKDYKILIVENGSKIEILKKTEDFIKQNKDIDWCRIENNKGFSNGNNFGYKFANEKYMPDYYFFMSNDTRLKSKNTIELLDYEYMQSRFDVASCDVINLYGRHTSPFTLNSDYPKSFIKTWLFQLNSGYHKYIKKEEQIDNYFWDRRVFNRKPQGSAMIFSKKAFDKLRFPFYPETYLYYEEHILGYNIHKNNMLSVHIPEIKILHKEGKTTKSYLNKIKRLKIQNDALKILINYTRKDKK